MSRSPSTHASEAETDEIPRRPGSGEYCAPPCAMVDRVHALERTARETDKRLHEGDLGFLDMRKDVQALTKAVNDAVEQIKANSGINWAHEILRSIISWGVPVGILVLVWALVGSGAVNIAKAHP